MFVQSNTIKAIKSYFKERLKDFYSESEIKIISNQSISMRLNLSRAELMLGDEMRLSESDLLYFRSVVIRLLQNEPMQYVLGDTVFFDLVIKCDKRALIPRPETEELVDWIVSDYKNQSELKVLDLCTGSGCIALALSSKMSQSEIFAVDLSPEALDLAKENANQLNLNVHFSMLDVLGHFDNTSFESSSFDIWVANPPYIPMNERELMHLNVLDFEPSMALFVENNEALIFYKAIAEKALLYLKPNGNLYFELNENFADETFKLIVQLGFENCELKLDLQGKKRMLKANKKGY